MIGRRPETKRFLLKRFQQLSSGEFLSFLLLSLFEEHPPLLSELY